MLVWTALGLLAGAGVLAGRWLLHPSDGLGRPKRFPLVSVIALAMVAVGLLVPVYRHHRLEQRLGAVASELVGAPVRVHCQSAGGAFVDLGPELGYVRYGRDGVLEHATLVKRAPCGALADYLGSGKDAPSRDQVIAVHVLTHEAMHMAGQTSESIAECEAVQRDARTAELLGATPAQARQLAAAYYAQVFPQMPDDYRSADCVVGGSLDERLPEAPWLSASRTVG